MTPLWGVRAAEDRARRRDRITRTARWELAHNRQERKYSPQAKFPYGTPWWVPLFLSPVVNRPSAMGIAHCAMGSHIASKTAVAC